MLKKRWWIAISVFIIILLVSIYFLFVREKPEPYYSDDPKTWVEKKGNIREVNVDKVTMGDGYVDNAGNEQYETEKIGTVFTLEGWYKGNYFSSFYRDEKNKIIMAITTDLNPNNGIIEGYIVEKIEQQKPVAYIFLDRDWKKQIPNTMIYWGKKYQNEKNFEFNEISDGIYMDRIFDDAGRFEDGYNIHAGGIYVGDLRDDNITTIISFS